MLSRSSRLSWSRCCRISCDGCDGPSSESLSLGITWPRGRIFRTSKLAFIRSRRCLSYAMRAVQMLPASVLWPPIFISSCLARNAVATTFGHHSMSSKDRKSTFQQVFRLPFCSVVLPVPDGSRAVLSLAVRSSARSHLPVRLSRAASSLVRPQDLDAGTYVARVVISGSNVLPTTNYMILVLGEATSPELGEEIRLGVAGPRERRAVRQADKQRQRFQLS